MARQQRLNVVHERSTATDHHLDEERLALLERHAAVAANRLIAPLLRQTQVIHGVPGLVQCAQESGEHVVGIETRGDPDVAGTAFGKGVLALVEPSAIEREADGLHHLDHQCALLAGRKLARQRQQSATLLDRDRLAGQAGQATRERLEHGVDVGGHEPGAELVHECIVRRQVQGLAEERGLVAHQMHDFFEVGREAVELALRACLEPATLRLGGRAA